MGLRIVTWNVNGIKNPFGYQPWRTERSLQAMFDTLEADIVIMQETKIQRKDLVDDMVLVPGWDVFFSLPRVKKGYSGVAIYTRTASCAPIRAEEGITGTLSAPRSTTSFRDLPEDRRIGGYPTPGQLNGKVDEAMLDSEGRCIILEFPAFVLLGVYSPATRDEARDDFRIEYLEALDARVRNLVALGKQAIVAGDLNVVGALIDTSRTAESLQREGITVQDWLDTPSRRLFNQLLFEREVSGVRDEGREQPVLWDLCRSFHPGREGMNTCWDTKKNTRPANFGSRIDYILCTDGLKDWFTYADIQEGLMGSDHCPVFATLCYDRFSDGGHEFIHDVMNPPGMVVGGRRQIGWSKGRLLPLSTRLIPEFDGRRNIQDMFFQQLSQLSNPASVELKDQGLPAVTSGAEDNQESSTPSLGRGGPGVTITEPKRRYGLSKDATENFVENSMSKRNLEGANVLAKSKRPKLAPGSSATTKNKPIAGQMTLKGFFKATTSDSTMARAERPKAESIAATQPSQTSITKTGGSFNANAVVAPPSNEASPKTSPRKTPEPSQLDSANTSPEKIFDPIEAKESWSKLLGRRVVPRCEHDEPCISLVTKKPGVNCGRSFYICGRPLGPSGEKEKDTEWRCGTFIWSSDWGRNVSMPSSSG